MQQTDNNTPKKNWWKRLGWAGFMFFLIKGLVWIAVFYGLADGLKKYFE